MAFWGSKWNLHTVCWGAVGCEWGTTSVYFGITYICFIPSKLPVFAVEPQYRLFCQKYHLKDTYKIFKKIYISLKFEWGLKDQYWLSCERLPFEFFWLPVWWPLWNYLCKHADDHSVTTEACSSPHLTCQGLCAMTAWKLNRAICAVDWQNVKKFMYSCTHLLKYVVSEPSARVLWQQISSKGFIPKVLHQIFSNLICFFLLTAPLTTDLSNQTECHWGSDFVIAGGTR